MAEIVRMPKMSDTMKEGVIVKWHKKAGDIVKSGDLMAEIETDKATMDYESFNNGTILYLGAKEGQTVQINDVLAIVGKPGEDFNALLKAGPAASVAPPPMAAAPSLPIKDVSSIKAEVVLMPKMSDTMQEGVIVAWYKKVGDTVKKGDLLAEIETDKATMEYESFQAGTLLYIGAKPKESIKINDVLAIIGDKDADWQTLLQHSQAGVTAAAPAAVSAPSVGTVARSAAPLISEPIKSNGRVKASPLARALAKAKGLDVADISGSGDGGRIVKRDVEQYAPGAASAGAHAASSSSSVFGVESYEDVPLSQMRKAIARRLSESKFSAPHFYLTIEANMDTMMAARKKINDAADIKISFNDIVIKAVAYALMKHKNVNVSWREDKLRINRHIHIGVAVAVPDGLVVPVVRFANQKSLAQISVEVKELAQKAADKKLQPADWEGSTFTISNLGMFGIDEFTSIINPPDACILAVGAIKEAPVVKNGQLAVGNVMKVTLSCDHRAVDGATGAAFLQTLKKALEAPIIML